MYDNHLRRKMARRPLRTGCDIMKHLARRRLLLQWHHILGLQTPHRKSLLSRNEQKALFISMIQRSNPPAPRDSCWTCRISAGHFWKMPLILHRKINPICVCLCLGEAGSRVYFPESWICKNISQVFKSNIAWFSTSRFSFWSKWSRKHFYRCNNMTVSHAQAYSKHTERPSPYGVSGRHEASCLWRTAGWLMSPLGYYKQRERGQRSTFKALSNAHFQGLKEDEKANDTFTVFMQIYRSQNKQFCRDSCKCASAKLWRKVRFAV